MKHIIKVNDIQDAKDNPTRPLIAMDANGVLFAEGKAAGPQIEFVDLGLSVKWRNALLGATNGDTAESWYGNYYAWGEIETKDVYSWDTYKYGNGLQNKLTKYCNMSSYGKDGFTDKLIQLVPEDDVATQTNPAWRIPSQVELNELKALPSKLVTDYNSITGLNGRVFTGKNGNTLFIPAAGFHAISSTESVGTSFYLQSSSLDLTTPIFSYVFRFGPFGTLSGANRNFGYSVCPVC